MRALTIVAVTTSRRTWLGLAAATAVAAAAAVVVLQPAGAATIDPTAYYQLTARHSGKALAVAGASTADGAAIVQQAGTGATSQQFQFVDAGSGYYRLRARHSGKVVDVSGRSTADGADVVQWPSNGGTNQQWSVQEIGPDISGGYVQFINRNSGKALDVWQASGAEGARVSQSTDTDATNQQFQLVRVATTPPTSSAPVPPAAYPNPGTVTGSTGAHDPSVTRTPAGTYLLATTGNNLALKTSTDRVAWRSAGTVWPGGAPWTTAYTGGSANLWAPDVSYRNGQYYLYYSASTFGSQRSAIFLATSPTGASGSWTNQGLVIESSTSVNYNAIDPNLVVDGAGQWWLTFGSFWSGIKLIRLDPATGRRSTSDTTVRALATRTTANGAIEAPFVHQHAGAYYLFVSFDVCCQGAASTYRVMVGRSTSVTGPYTDRNGTALTAGGGTQVLAGHGSIHGPGHQAVIADTDGDVLCYHYYADSGASFLGINRLGWDAAGWPFVY
jgi:arabinan endo-1,5-alpha-L-arabinosidase